MLGFKKQIYSIFFALILVCVSNVQAAADICYNQNIARENRDVFNQDRIDQLIEEYPELDFKGLEFSFEPKSAMGSAAGETMILFQSKSLVNTLTGIATPVEGSETITVPSMRFDGETPMPESSLAYTWIHENAHLFYYRYLSEKQRDQWENMYKQNRTSVTDYGTTEAKEDFAEWFTFYFYPSVFAHRYCFPDYALRMDHVKNKFMENVRQEHRQRLGWLTPVTDFLISMKNNSRGSILSSTSENLARNDYRKKNGYAFSAAPKQDPVVEEKEVFPEPEPEQLVQNPQPREPKEVKMTYSTGRGTPGVRGKSPRRTRLSTFNTRKGGHAPGFLKRRPRVPSRVSVEPQEDDPEVAIENTLRKIPDSVQKHLNKRKEQIRKASLQATRTGSEEESREAFLDFIRERKMNR